MFTYEIKDNNRYSYSPGFHEDSCAETVVSWQQPEQDAKVCIWDGSAIRMKTVNEMLTCNNLPTVEHLHPQPFTPTETRFFYQFPWPTSNKALQHAILRYVRDGMAWQAKLVEIIAELSANPDNIKGLMAESGSLWALSYRVNPKVWVPKLDEYWQEIIMLQDGILANALLVWNGYEDWLSEAYMQQANKYHLGPITVVFPENAKTIGEVINETNCRDCANRLINYSSFLVRLPSPMSGYARTFNLTKALLESLEWEVN